MTVDERRTSRVQFKDEIQVDKTEEVQTEDDKTTERDLEAEFAGIFEGPEGGEVFLFSFRNPNLAQISLSRCTNPIVPATVFLKS